MAKRFILFFSLALPLYIGTLVYIVLGVRYLTEASKAATKPAGHLHTVTSIALAALFYFILAFFYWTYWGDFWDYYGWDYHWDRYFWQ